MKNDLHFIIITILSIITISCNKGDADIEKETPQDDSFFTDLPKSYHFDRLEQKNSVLMYTETGEIENTVLITDFIGDIESFKLEEMANYYQHESYGFIDNNILEHEILWGGETETFYYVKKSDSIILKSDTLELMVNPNCTYNEIVCSFGSWVIDSIAYYPDSSKYYYVINKVFVVSGGELRIPQFGYYYSSLNFRAWGTEESVFDESVLNNLTNDTLAIYQYDVVFSEE